MSQKPLALRPHDVCVLLQLVQRPGVTFRGLAASVGLSVGEAHNATKRLEVARLYISHLREANHQALLDFLVSGVPYVFPGELGPETQGVPTAFSGPVLADRMSASHGVVWPSAEGHSRGMALVPLCSSAPSMVVKNPPLYRLLTLVDALRVGRARERKLAKTLLEDELGRWL